MMVRAPASAARWPALALLLAGAAGCGSGSGAPAPSGATAPPGVTVSGAVTFDLVPATPGIGLDYAAARAAPARGVTVELLADDDAAALAATSTDEEGQYVFADVPPDIDVRIRVRAEMVRSGAPAWDFSVRDNTDDDALYVLEGTPFRTGEDDVTQDLHAASGWDGAGYGEPRAAAPFAVLDVVWEALDFVLAAEPQADFPPLDIHWSPANTPVLPEDGAPNLATGEIGTSFFSPPLGLFLLGAEDEDTDEYDRHVVAHEWAHYYEWAFSRLDSIGGPHGLGDQLDKRVAFSEGLANALGALITGETRYVDVFGPGQGTWFAFDVAGSPAGPATAGWYSESSVQEIAYALAAEDGILGFARVHALLTGEHRDSDALISIFSLLDAARREHPSEAPLIQELAASHGIEPTADAFGSGETNAGEPPHPDVLPVYTDLGVNQGAVNVCSTDAFGAVNKLASRRFLKLSIASPDSYTLSATTTSMPPGTSADPDMVLHRRGAATRSDRPPTEACLAGADPAECFERLATTLSPGDYVVEVYEWTNTNDPSAAQPPIGRTCFDVEVTQP